jgi:hypothetical protein
LDSVIEKSNVEQAAAVHLTSQLEAADLQGFGWQLPQLAVIPNGVDNPAACDGRITRMLMRLPRGTTARFVSRDAQLEEGIATAFAFLMRDR